MLNNQDDICNTSVTLRNIIKISDVNLTSVKIQTLILINNSVFTHKPLKKLTKAPHLPQTLLLLFSFFIII